MKIWSSSSPRHLPVVLGKLRLLHGLCGVDHPGAHAAVVALQPRVQPQIATDVGEVAEGQLGTQVPGQDAETAGENHLRSRDLVETLVITERTPYDHTYSMFFNGQ